MKGARRKDSIFKSLLIGNVRLLSVFKDFPIEKDFSMTFKNDCEWRVSAQCENVFWIMIPSRERAGGLLFLGHWSIDWISHAGEKRHVLVKSPRWLSRSQNWTIRLKQILFSIMQIILADCCEAETEFISFLRFVALRKAISLLQEFLRKVKWFMNKRFALCSAFFAENKNFLCHLSSRRGGEWEIVWALFFMVIYLEELRLRLEVNQSREILLALS